MATVPVPRTWVTGEVVTAAFLNGVRDALNFFLAPPLAVLRATSAQSVTNATFTAALLDTEDTDRDGGHSTVTNTSRYLPPTPGWYAAHATLAFASNVTGLRILNFALSGTLQGAGTVQTPTVTTGGSNSVLTGSGTYYLTGSNYLEVQGYQTSGGALNMTGYMSALWIST